MHTSAIKQDLIQQLNTLNEQKQFLADSDMEKLDWAKSTIESQKNLDRLKSAARINEILLYALLAITGVMALLRVFDFGYQPDLNKGALFIFLAVSNAGVALRQKIKIARLEKQFLLINLLGKLDTHKSNEESNQ